jgi:hypothetical protein
MVDPMVEDAEEPGPHAAARREAGPRFDRRDEARVHEVLGGGGVADPRARARSQSWCERVVGPRESLRVVRPAELTEVRVDRIGRDRTHRRPRTGSAADSTPSRSWAEEKTRCRARRGLGRVAMRSS